MGRLMVTVRVLDEGDDAVHILGTASLNETLCGFADVNHEVLDASLYPPNCPHCLKIVRYCRNLKIPTKIKEL